MHHAPGIVVAARGETVDTTMRRHRRRGFRRRFERMHHRNVRD